MPYIFTDLPADSSELETYNGYHVARTATVARGGPVRQDEPGELILSYPNATRSNRDVERTAHRGAGAMTRFMPGRSYDAPKFVTNGQLASLAIVPCLCYLMVWFLGRF